MKFSRFGPMWGSVAEQYERIREDRPIDRDGFRRIVAEGGFSQTLMLNDRRVLESLFDWHIAELARQGHSILDAPGNYSEAAILPDCQLFRLGDRLLGTDFLRLYSYLQTIRTTLPTLSDPRLIVEIGSGYGAMSRLLKLAWPRATVCLIDIGPSLNIAEFYIRSAFPNLKVVRLREPRRIPDADFILIDAVEASGLDRQVFDLAVNTWSLGEMPNSEISGWFDFLQKRHEVSHLFSLNHFLVTTELNGSSVEQATHYYDWVDRMDDRWHVTSCIIDPPIHRAPMLRSQHLGLTISARRLTEPQHIQSEKAAAAAAAAAVHRHQWLGSSVAGIVPPDSDPHGARRKLLNAPPEVDHATVFRLDQITSQLNVWRPDFGPEAFFPLWNDVRVNRSPLSIRALRIWLHLQWRPRHRTEEGPIDTVFREELTYAKALTGRIERDAQLILPGWFSAFVD